MNPVTDAIEVFLAVFNCIPLSIRNFIFLVLGLFFIVGLIRIILRL